jgi:glycosyltransferase involved in cell wall biosynthesis
MKIFIDLTSLARKLTGIENYTLNLINAMVKQDTINEYHLVFRTSINAEFNGLNRQGIIFYLSPFKSQLLTEQIYLPYLILKKHFTFCFFPCFPPGLLTFGKIFTICYDATMWRYKKTLSIKNRFYFKPLSQLGMRRAESIFTISESSKKDIEQCFPHYKEKIYNVSAALPNSFINPVFLNSKVIFKKYSISKKYIICVGSIEPRKNLQFVIENIEHILKKRDMQLVLVGRKAWGSKELALKIEKNKLADCIVQTGYITTNELQTLYNGAECFLFPSLYEGFGFPILEAFACECPVITSNVSSMPEVAGDAALLIDPRNGKMLIDAIECILKHQDLKNDLVRRGKERLKQFSWENSANLCINAICK